MRRAAATLSLLLAAGIASLLLAACGSEDRTEPTSSTRMPLASSSATPNRSQAESTESVARPSASAAKPSASAAKPSASAAKQAAYALAPLLYFPKMKVPVENPLSADKIALGKKLFFDKKLGRNFACSDCHRPERGWADGLTRSKRADGQLNKRHTPSLYNAGYQRMWGWDGRAKTLEAMVREQWASQLAVSPAAAAKAIAAEPSYRPLFVTAFGSGAITEPGIVDALASFVRSLRNGNAPRDRFEKGDKQAMSASAQRGWLVFRDKGGCAACHVPPLFTDNRFHNIGVGYAGGKSDDPGREGITGRDRDRGAFKTPSLRPAARTAPYFHDGSAATLEAAVAYVLSGGHANPQRDSGLIKLDLTAAQRTDLLAFIRALDGAP